MVSPVLIIFKGPQTSNIRNFETSANYNSFLHTVQAASAFPSKSILSAGGQSSLPIPEVLQGHYCNKQF